MKDELHAIIPSLSLVLAWGTYSSPSLDRLVPALGYVKGNVQVISWRANKLKGEGTAEDHRLIAEWMERNGAA